MCNVPPHADHDVIRRVVAAEESHVTIRWLDRLIDALRLYSNIVDDVMMYVRLIVGIWRG